MVRQILKGANMSKFHARRGRPWRLWSLLAGLLTSAALAQGLPDMAGIKEAFQKQQQANEQALRQYSWKSRTEVRVGGEVKSTVLQTVRYGADGAPQKTVIGGQQAREKSRPLQKTPIGALVKQIKKKKTEEFNDGLRKLLEAYAEIPDESMRRFLAHAAFQPGQDAMQGTVRIFGNNVVKDRDALNIWVDPKTREQRQLEILTSLEGDPVRVVSQFGKLPDGTTYTKLTAVEIKPKDLNLITENFDFTRGNTP
jgi:hypothetical protein